MRNVYKFIKDILNLKNQADKKVCGYSANLFGYLLFLIYAFYYVDKDLFGG